jgi:hypothetical protein
MDNLGRRYDHIELYGAAKVGGHAREDGLLSGAYIYPPAQPGAVSFTLVNGDQPSSIAGLNLSTRAP